MYSIKKLMFTTFNNTEDKKKPKSPTLRTHHLLYMDENHLSFDGGEYIKEIFRPIFMTMAKQ